MRLARSTRLVFAIALAMGSSLPSAVAWAQSERPTVSATATLSILQGQVQRIPVGAETPETAVDGANLTAGDRIITAPGAYALVTFLDGSTATVGGGLAGVADIVIRRIEPTGRGGLDIGIFINVGQVWGRVVRLFDSGARFTLESNSATAVTDYGLPGGRVNLDGTFDCWTVSGEMNVANEQGELTLGAGQQTNITNGVIGNPHPFGIFQSFLLINSSATVLPLIRMANDELVLGFIAPGIEVNQVLGSFTGRGDEGAYLIAAQGGYSQPFTLALEAREDGPFTVVVAGQFQGEVVYREELHGIAMKGERLSLEITHVLDPPDPTTRAERADARLLAVALGPLQPLVGPIPGKVLLSSTELELGSVTGRGDEGAYFIEVQGGWPQGFLSR